MKINKTPCCTKGVKFLLNKKKGGGREHGVSFNLNLWSHTPPLLQARVREFCPSVSVASIRIFPFTAMSSSPGTIPPTKTEVTDI